MNFDEEIDKLEERFRDNQFRENTDPNLLEELQHVYTELTKNLYGYNQLVKENKTDEILDAARTIVIQRINKCKELAGIN